MERPRLSLAVSTVPRNSDNTVKDSLVQNAFIDKSKSGSEFVVKRPGFLVNLEAITTGLNRGIFLSPFNNQNYYVNNTNNIIGYAPSNYYSGNTTYGLNQVVYFRNPVTGETEAYYSQQANNTNNPVYINNVLNTASWNKTPFVAPSEILIISFDVVGAVAPYTLQLLYGVDNPPGAIASSIRYVTVENPEQPVSFVFEGGSTSLLAFENPNGSYKATYTGTTLKFYKNNVLRQSGSITGLNPATLAFTSVFTEGIGTINNIVLGP